VSLRRYALAADLLEAGAKGANATRLLNLAAMLRRTVRIDDLKPQDTLEDFVRQSMILALTPDLTLEKARSVESVNAIKANPSPTPKERDKLLHHASRVVTRSAIAAGISPEAMADIALQAIQIKSSGDDATGYQVYLTAGAQPTQEEIYVREKGRLKVLAQISDPAPVGLEVLDRVNRGDIAGARRLLDWVYAAEPHAASEDPYAGTAFSHIWTSDQNEPERRSLTLAAAALLVRSEHTAPRGIQLLEDMKRNETRATEIDKVNLALLSGYVIAKNYERAVETASDLAVRSVNSPSLILTQLREMCLADHCAEAEQLARARLAALRNDLATRRALGSILVHQGRNEDAYQTFREVTEDPKAEASDYNMLAWSTLFFTRREGPDLESAQRAVQMSERNFGALHTLATIYAELGRLKEAREVLLQALDVSGADEPESNSWYTFGRIAEQYGEVDVALVDYGKVTPPDDIRNIAGSTYSLALNRIAELKAATSGTIPSAKHIVVAADSGAH